MVASICMIKTTMSHRMSSQKYVQHYRSWKQEIYLITLVPSYLIKDWCFKMKPYTDLICSVCYVFEVKWFSLFPCLCGSSGISSMGHTPVFSLSDSCMGTEPTPLYLSADATHRSVQHISQNKCCVHCVTRTGHNMYY